jgi:thiol-disulfide isomerase/thioredoxin
MPSLAGAAEWINSEPLDPAGLLGRAVVVNFWTLTCINWLRQEPYVRAWSQAYRDDGLVVIGVHTPEFSFEHEVEDVRRATTERGIDYPVAVDNDYAIWRAFDNNYWPALYFVDREGIIRDQHFGEGRYEQSERIIQELLGLERQLAAVDPRGVEAQADWDQLRTPETYLGYARGERFASPGGQVPGESRVFELPERLRLNDWALVGEWTVGPENVVMDREGGSIGFRSACSWMARHPAGHTAWTSTVTGTVYSERAACINCCASTVRYASGRWKSVSSRLAPRPIRSRSGRPLTLTFAWQ